MKLRTLVLMIISITLSTAIFAGVKDLTWHSRANCGNNESISWHAGHNNMLMTVSDHLLGGRI